MRILFIGPSPYLPTGFGRVIKYFSMKLIEKGYEVATIDTQRVIPPDIDERIGKGFKIYPGVQGDVWFRAINEFNPDVIIPVFSLWVEPYKSFARIMQQNNPRIKIILYAPFEYLTLSDMYFESLLGAHLVIVPNRISERYLKNHIGNEFVRYVPHGFDDKIFRPLKNDMNDDERRIFNDLKKIFNDKIVYLFVGRNNLRKEIGTLIMAYRMLPGSIRKESILALYTRLQEITPSTIGASLGWDIVRLTKKYGIEENVFVFHNWATAEWGVEDWMMNIIYNASDIYVHPSSGEGFGLPIVEAMGAGLPVIASGNTSMLEFCGENEEYCLLAEPMGMVESWEGFCYTPTNPESLADKMELMFNDDIRRKYINKSLERRKDYTWDKAIEYFEKALDYVFQQTTRISNYRWDVLSEDYEINPWFRNVAKRMRK